MEQTFKPEANVNMLLHQVFDTMLSFAARVLGGEMPDDDATTQWALNRYTALLYLTFVKSF